VLIAHYNYEDYIGQAIESVLGQSYRDFELVICDDGSTDNSPSIIESYAKRDSRIHFVRQANAGVGFVDQHGVQSKQRRNYLFPRRR